MWHVHAPVCGWGGVWAAGGRGGRLVLPGRNPGHRLPVRLGDARWRHPPAAHLSGNLRRRRRRLTDRRRRAQRLRGDDLLRGRKKSTK